MELWQAIILAIVEGLTEYLPISSTGHLIVTSALLGINENAFVKDFVVMVQFGAILSVVFLYWRRFIQGWQVYLKLFVAFLPAAAIGFAVKGVIDNILGDVMVVAIAFIVGGVILIGAERWLGKRNKSLTLEKMSLKNCLAIGFIQCFALIPGVSRSAATILGGLFEGLDRRAAAEFSFLLAVPTLTAASAYKLLKIWPHIESSQISILAIGNVVSFIVGVITIKAFIDFLAKHSFKSFGIYRIVLGAILIAMMTLGHSLKMM